MAGIGAKRPFTEVTLIDRPNPGFRFERLIEIVNFHNASGEELAAMAAMFGIASGLRDGARRALEQRLAR